MSKKTTFGVIVGNRGFFPNHLCDEGRREVLSVLDGEGIGAIALTPQDTPFGSVETREHAARCADLFKKRADEIDGILVTLPNFGDERGVSEAIRMAGLGVPVLIHAYPDEAGRMTIKDRRDSFCGKMSVCNNLTQYGVDYSLTDLHTVAPTSPAFREDLRKFAATCRVVKGLRNARIGAVGARPAAFATVRFSEKILEAHGISVQPIDLFEVMGKAGKLDDSAQAVQAKLKAVKDYVDVSGVPEPALLKMAKLGVVLDEWSAENELVATAIQCWTAMEEFYGVVPCTVMSMMSDRLMPSACEVDVTGAVGMYALTLASGVPAALLDWNNNYGADPDKCVLFHCSNIPRSCMSCARMSVQDIIGGTVGIENTCGTIVGRIKSGPFTFCRVATSDLEGTITAYVGEGEFTDDPLETFGGAGVAEIPDLQALLRYMCETGFEHHVAAAHATVADAMAEAMGTYLGWDVYQHGG
jgi:L-fucose isomerase-like protein